jgi:predicted nucleic acid-binding protein
MNVVDSSGWLEYLSSGRNLDAFVEPISNSDELLVPSILISEVFRRMYRMRGEEETYNAVARMSVNVVVDLNTNIAVSAAELSIEHRLALADSIIYVTARACSAMLWTQDSDFEALEGVRYIPHWSRTRD